MNQSNRINTLSDNPAGKFRQILNKVPEVTLYFWIIKVLCTTVGETASDFLNVNLNLGLIGTAVAMGVCLLVVMSFQFRAKKYVPALYWLTVVLISVFGTLLTDILTDNLHIPLAASTVFFSIALAITFAVWYAKEGTLSIHSIFTVRREAFYWSAILFTFALGTASGDLMAESLAFGYLGTGLIICAVIVVVTVAWRFGLDVILAFWLVYIMTRPLGASLGDYLSQIQGNGGLGFGAAVTSAIFLAAILAVVIFLTVTRRDLVAVSEPAVEPKKTRISALWQVIGVVAVLVAVSGVGYNWRSTQLAKLQVANASSPAPLGDLSAFRKITGDTLGLVRAGDMSGAKARITDLETAWDGAQAHLKPMNPDKWTELDTAIDPVLRNLRESKPDAKVCITSLQSLIDLLNYSGPNFSDTKVT